MPIAALVPATPADAVDPKPATIDVISGITLSIILFTPKSTAISANALAESFIISSFEYSPVVSLLYLLMFDDNSAANPIIERASNKLPILPVAFCKSLEIHP